MAVGRDPIRPIRRVRLMPLVPTASLVRVMRLVPTANPVRVMRLVLTANPVLLMRLVPTANPVRLMPLVLTASLVRLMPLVPTANPVRVMRLVLAIKAKARPKEARVMPRARVTERLQRGLTDIQTARVTIRPRAIVLETSSAVTGLKTRAPSKKAGSGEILPRLDGYNKPGRMGQLVAPVAPPRYQSGLGKPNVGLARRFIG